MLMNVKGMYIKSLHTKKKYANHTQKSFKLEMYAFCKYKQCTN